MKKTKNTSGIKFYYYHQNTNETVWVSQKEIDLLYDGKISNYPKQLKTIQAKSQSDAIFKLDVIEQ